jgi:hypothetical protein
MGMVSELARVFSSQGVVIPGSERIPVYRKSQPEAPCDHKGNCSCFAPKFDQAAAKLELSRQGKDRAAGESSGNAAGPKKADGKPLDDDEKKQVEGLEKRDREVKAHEAAHMAAAGGNAKGGAGYEYQTGPDGRQYAVGGHVDIDVSPVKGNPQATLAKAQTVQRAALAPADPSGQDRAVASAAVQMAMQAQKEIDKGEGQGKGQGNGEEGGENGNPESIRSARIRSYGKARPLAGVSMNIVG